MGKLKSTDVWSNIANQVGSDRHCSILDKLAVCHGEMDERIVQLHENSQTLEEIAEILGLTQFDTVQRYRRILHDSR